VRFDNLKISINQNSFEYFEMISFYKNWRENPASSRIKLVENIDPISLIKVESISERGLGKVG